MTQQQQSNIKPTQQQQPTATATTLLPALVPHCVLRPLIALHHFFAHFGTLFHASLVIAPLLRFGGPFLRLSTAGLPRCAVISLYHCWLYRRSFFTLPLRSSFANHHHATTTTTTATPCNSCDA
jgi:hypothetical protein